MRFIIIIIIVMFSSINLLSSQDLVQNGDFDDLRKENRWFFLRHVRHWYKPTLASSDYQSNEYHWHHFDYCPPYSGNAYIGIVLLESNYNYAEYATNRLKSKLLKDSLYCVSMYVCLSFGSSIAPQGPDIHFSSKRIKRFTKKSIANKYSIDVSKIGKRPISNIGIWEKREGLYKAKGNERYMTIGLFSQEKDYFQINSKKHQKRDRNCYVLIDNVSLISMSDSSQCHCNKIYKDLNPIELNIDTNSNESDNDLSAGTVFRLNNLFFKINSAAIDSASLGDLNTLLTILKIDTILIIQINGHTDSDGNSKVNQRLSERRAKSVVDYLVDNGISKKRLKYKGYGENYPLATNATKGGRAINRRVEFEIMRVEAHK